MILRAPKTPHSAEAWLSRLSAHLTCEIKQYVCMREINRKKTTWNLSSISCRLHEYCMRKMTLASAFTPILSIKMWFCVKVLIKCGSKDWHVWVWPRIHGFILETLNKCSKTTFKLCQTVTLTQRIHLMCLLPLFLKLASDQGPGNLSLIWLMALMANATIEQNLLVAPHYSSGPWRRLFY